MGKGTRQRMKVPGTKQIRACASYAGDGSDRTEVLGD